MKLFDINQHNRFTAILTMYQSFIVKERLDNSIFDYRSPYIDMVQGLLLFLEKEIGNCILHPSVKYSPGSLPMIE